MRMMIMGKIAIDEMGNLYEVAISQNKTSDTAKKKILDTDSAKKERFVKKVSKSVTKKN